MRKIQLTRKPERAFTRPPGTEGLVHLVEGMGICVRFRRLPHSACYGVHVYPPGASCTPRFLGTLAACLEAPEEALRQKVHHFFPRSTAQYAAMQKKGRPS